MGLIKTGLKFAKKVTLIKLPKKVKETLDEIVEEE